MNYDLIIFDCDGTLVDTEHLNCLSCAESIQGAGFPDYDVDVIFTRFVGVHFDDILAQIAAETGRPFPDDMRQRFIDRVQNNAGQYLERLEGALRVVEQAQSRFKICVASNGERPNVLASVEAADLKPYFTDHAIFTAADVVNPKPAPDLFLHAAKTMEALPEKTIVIEDTPTGVKAGKAAGMFTVGYCGSRTDPGDHAQVLTEAGADHTVLSHREFSAFLKTRAAA